MEYRRKGSFIPVTCTYWRNSSCFKGDRCSFVHGFVCRDDGICSDPLCNKSHFKQRDPSTYLRVRGRNGSHQRYRSRSRSPYRKSRSPYSPRRRQFSPRRRSRTPRKGLRKSYSPNSPRRSYSPRSRSRSHSHSHSSRSYSPYKKSKRSRSESRSRSRSRSRSKSRSRSRSRSKSSQSGRKSPLQKITSPAIKGHTSESPHTKIAGQVDQSITKKKIVSDEKDEDKDVLIIKESQSDMLFESPEEREGKAKKIAPNPKFKPIVEENITDMFKEASSKVQFPPPETAHSENLSPSSRALEILKNLPKDFFSSVNSEESTKAEVTKEREKKVEKEIFKSSIEQDSFREAFLKALNGSGGSANKGVKDEAKGAPLPPVLKHPQNVENLAKPFQEKMFGFDKGNDKNPEPNLWTPALDRNKPQQAKLQSENLAVSSWEIDTPYVCRNTRDQQPQPVASGSKTVLHTSSASIPPLHPPLLPPPLPPTMSGEESKKKRRRKKRRSSSSSCSSSEDENEEKKKAESDEVALERKKKILSKVWTLMEQKKKLEAQRDEVVLSHKGDGKSLAVLLKENGVLSSEIDRQIFVMNQMVQAINDKLGMSKMEAQQQEFFFQPTMYKDARIFHPPGKKNFLAEKMLEKTKSKFLKPDEEGNKKPSSPSSSKRPKKNVKPRSKSKSRSRSKSRSKSRERKRSPSSEKKLSKKYVYDKKIKKEKSPLLEDVKPKRKKEVKKTSLISTKSKTHSKVVGEVEYAPSPAMKPHIKYIDQGMHWCKICSDFLGTVQDYVNHLETGIHLDKLKDDPKTWLPKAPKVEKDPIDPNAPVLTIPLQGMEFMHSITAFYCSLCDVFIKTKEEGQMHPETKLHVSKYKEYLSKNPMYETSYVKDKMAAFAQYSVDKERRKEKNPSLENLKSQVFFSEVKNNTDEDMKASPPPKPLPKKEPHSKPKEVADGVQTSGASIRVASRGSASAAGGGGEEKLSAKNGHDASSSAEVVKTSKTSVLMECIEDEGKRSLSEDEHQKLLALKRRVAEIKEGIPSSPLPLVGGEKEQIVGNVVDNEEEEEQTEMKNAFKDRENLPGEESLASLESKSVPPPQHFDQSTQPASKLSIKKYSNVIIGKMPFLKKSKGAPPPPKVSLAESKVQSESETSVVSQAEARIRQIVSEGLPLVTHKETEPFVSLPPTVPRNVEYITEIESCDSGTTFTKKFGPTLDSYVSSDDEGCEAPMDISHDEENSWDEFIPKENRPSLRDIPVPVDPKLTPKLSGSSFESKIKVDLNTPHLSQLSAAAAIYKEAVTYQPLPMPPVPPSMIAPVPIMPPVPPMIPVYPPFSEVSRCSIPDSLIEGFNPPPPGTEEGSSNHSSGNAHSDGADSPDSFLCQKTPPPPGTEDDNLKPKPVQLSHAKSSAPLEIDSKVEGTEFFKDILADVPVMVFGSSSLGEVAKDEGSQESLVQEGLELLEFADEDDQTEEKLLRNESAPKSLLSGSCEKVTP